MTLPYQPLISYIRKTDDRPDIVWNTSLKNFLPVRILTAHRPLLKTASNGDDLTFPKELPTGSGFIQSDHGAFVREKRTDPAILFANIGYTHNFEGDFSDISSSPGNQPGKVKLGDSIHYGVGMAFALNERTSMSLSLSQRISQESENPARWCFQGGSNWQ